VLGRLGQIAGGHWDTRQPPTATQRASQEVARGELEQTTVELQRLLEVDLPALEAAVLMPQQQFGGRYLHPGVAEMAAAYLFHICRNHAFNDGNKRVGVLAALIFLKVNGVDRLPEPDDLMVATFEVASGERSKEALTEWFRVEIGDFPLP